MSLKDTLRFIGLLLIGLAVAVIIYNLPQGRPRPRPVYKMAPEIEASLTDDIRYMQRWRKDIDDCPVGGVRVIGNGLWRKERQLADVHETKGGKNENH